MAKRLYVGNLPYSVTEDDIREMFEKHGPVDAVAHVRPIAEAGLSPFTPSCRTDWVSIHHTVIPLTAR